MEHLLTEKEACSAPLFSKDFVRQPFYFVVGFSYQINALSTICMALSVQYFFFSLS